MMMDQTFARTVSGDSQHIKMSASPSPGKLKQVFKAIISHAVVRSFQGFNEKS